MRVPEDPVSLTPDQIAELNSKLSHMRHDINNHLSLIVAASELIRHQPETAEKRVNTLLDQVPRVTNALAAFSAEFEKAFGIKR
jgi:hypothetical protein